MFDEPFHRKQFLRAPPSMASSVAAVLEPLVATGTLAFFHAWFGVSMEGVPTALGLLLVVLMFPGVNRFGRTGPSVALDILLTWVWVLGIVALLGYATGTLASVDARTMLAWAIATPLLQWALVATGSVLLRRWSSLPQTRRPALVVGAGRMGLRVAEVLHQRQAFGHDLVGFVDDRCAERVGLPPEAAVLGPLERLPEIVERRGVRDVFITLPLTSQPRILGLLERLQNTTASIHFVPDVFGVSVIQGRLEDMGGVPVVGLMVEPFTGLDGFVKRLSDIAIACALLILVSPVMAALAIGVKLSSPGPVIFRQRRTGLDGEIIEVYKFRSMRTQDDGAVVRQATRGDPRITPFGAFIRKTSLDELPQLFNVLQGRMSIVGPRPHALAHNEQYRRLVKAYMARHKVRPGITGWAQVNGLRGETDTLDKMIARVEYDLEYLRNWSLGLDLVIIARTVRVVFSDQKAY